MKCTKNIILLRVKNIVISIFLNKDYKKELIKMAFNIWQISVLSDGGSMSKLLSENLRAHTAY